MTQQFLPEYYHDTAVYSGLLLDRSSFTKSNLFIISLISRVQELSSLSSLNKKIHLYIYVKPGSLEAPTPRPHWMDCFVMHYFLIQSFKILLLEETFQLNTSKLCLLAQKDSFRVVKTLS